MADSKIKGGRVLFASRLRIAQGLMILIAGGSFVACHKKGPPPPKPEPVVVKKSPEEMKKLADAANKSLEGLKPLLAALNAKYDSLHKQFDPLPTDLPEFGETRSKFYAADEGIGRMNAKLSWASNQIDAADKSGNGAQLEEISQSLARTYDDVKEADQLALELMHEVMPFTRMADNYAANTKGMCDPGGVSAAPGGGVSRAAVAKKMLAH